MIRSAQLLACFLLAAPAFAQDAPLILYVNTDAVGANDGLTWQDAFTDVQAALEAARLESAVREIWIAKGTYLPTDSNDPAISFELVDGVDLVGGFAGDEETREAADPIANPTVLSGDIGTVDAAGDNTFHVVVAEGLGLSAAGPVVLAGLTVQRGYAGRSSLGGPPELYPEETQGGCLRVLESSVVMRAVTVESCSAGIYGPPPRLGFGGGIYLSESTLRMEDSLVRNNSASTYGGGAGGGLYAAGSDVEIVRSVFEGNRSSGFSDGRGGGIYTESSALRVEASSFRSNSVGGEGAIGGAVRVDGRATFRDVEFIGNRALADGYGGALAVERLTRADLVNVTLIGNRAGGGGAFYGTGVASTSITNAVFAMSQARGTTSDGDPFSGGGGGGGALLLVGGHEATIASATFLGNTSREYFGPSPSRGHNALVGGTARLTLFNSIVVDQPGYSLSTKSSGQVEVRSSLVEGGADGLDVTDGRPMFIRLPSAGADEAWATHDDDLGDLRMMPLSLGIDLGNQDLLPDDELDLDDDGDTDEALPLDLLGAERVQRGLLDLGAYESPYSVDAAPSTASQPGPVLSQAYPNPATSTVTLALTMASAEHIEVDVLNRLGQRVGLIHSGLLAPGTQYVSWDSDAHPAGLYVIRVRGTGWQQARRIVRVP